MLFSYVLLPLAAGAGTKIPLTIKKVPDFSMRAPGHTGVNIGEYDGTGSIDGIGDSAVIINDQSFTLAPSVNVSKVDGSKLSVSKLTRGMTVYYFFDRNGLVSKLVVKP